MRKNILYLSFLIFVSCYGTKEISYKKARQLDSKKDYQIILNKKVKIDLQKYYLDINNISKIMVDKKSKIINISQKQKDPKSLNLTQVVTEQFKSNFEINKKDSISLILINGILVNKNDLKSYYIENNAIKSISLLKNADVNTLDCRKNEGNNVLIILTK